MMNFKQNICCVVALVVMITSCKKEVASVISAPVHLLIYTKTKAYRHECIEPGVEAMKIYFAKYGINSVQSEDSTMFTDEKLKSFQAVMFFQTTGNVLDSLQQIAFQTYLQHGHGFVGVHSAADTEYDWPWFGELVGARFSNHPDIQSGVVVRSDSAMVAVAHLPARWTRTDEWYNFKALPQNVRVELYADESTFTGGELGANHPLAWYHTFEGSRAYYTALGHTVESYQDTLFLEHLAKAVIWASK